MRKSAVVVMALGLMLMLSSVAAAAPWTQKVKVDVVISGNAVVTGQVHSDGTNIRGALHYYNETYGLDVSLVKPICLVIDDSVTPSRVFIKGETRVLENSTGFWPHDPGDWVVFIYNEYQVTGQGWNGPLTWRDHDTDSCVPDWNSRGSMTGTVTVTTR